MANQWRARRPHRGPKDTQGFHDPKAGKMKLRTVHIREFKSIRDSNPFAIGQTTCLVGKNEAGKTAILQALYRLNPIIEADGVFDVTFDYPKLDVEDYLQDVEAGRRKPATVVEATFALESTEIAQVEKEFGAGVLPERGVTIFRGYAKGSDGKNTLLYSLNADESVAVRHLCRALPPAAQKATENCSTVADLRTALERVSKECEQAVAQATAAANAVADDAEKAAALARVPSLGEDPASQALRARLAKVGALRDHIWSTMLRGHLPKFLYFDEYYQLEGRANVPALKERKTTGNLRPSDLPLLGLIDLARLDLDAILGMTRTEELKNKLQNASNHLSKKILQYWSQNKHLKMAFDVREGLPNDPEDMAEGFNIWGEVHDKRHEVSTGLGTRSRGFVWFFSFLAWYSSEKKNDRPLVLLLDEPGLSLHGRAQGDLLEYFENEINSNPKHQLIYTTHSPFMVDPEHFENVRIAQDKGIDADEALTPEQDGTKVFTDVLLAGEDSLFPLQGALGYEIHQTLFVGPNCLIVEGVSDLLYLQTLSGILEGTGRSGLDKRWTITPVGGADKVPTFVALLGSQKKLKLATLIDLQQKDKQSIENLYKRKLLKKSNVLTFADFTAKPESDIEDMFDAEFYLGLVNGEFKPAKAVVAATLNSNLPRMVARLEQYFDQNPLGGDAQYNHYRPARYFAENPSRCGPVPEPTLARFEQAFAALNKLL